MVDRMSASLAFSVAALVISAGSVVFAWRSAIAARQSAVAAEGSLAVERERWVSTLTSSLSDRFGLGHDLLPPCQAQLDCPVSDRERPTEPTRSGTAVARFVIESART